MQPLPSPITVYSSETGRSYTLESLIGKGGYGEVYLATPSPGHGLPGKVCVKITERQSGWLREAYFAQLNKRESRALQVFDIFVEPEGKGMRYCLAMEYAEYGDLGTWLKKAGAQKESVVRRELAALLSTLDSLHRGQAMHRDLTPFNIFVCDNERLKLGDFGIAAHQRNKSGVTADAFNPFNAPTEIAWGKVRKWQQRDDIYQVGLLASMLLRGDIDGPMRSKDVRTLPCSDHLKEVIHRCLGARDKRYQAASELIDALRNPPKTPGRGRIDALKGLRISFTGFLVRPRAEAIAAAKKAGAVVQSRPGASTDVLVRGRPNALQIAGAAGGTKLMDIRRLAEKGHRIKVIDEARFWRLVASARGKGRVSGARRGKPVAKRAKRAGGR